MFHCNVFFIFYKIDTRLNVTKTNDSVDSDNSSPRSTLAACLPNISTKDPSEIKGIYEITIDFMEYQQ